MDIPASPTTTLTTALTSQAASSGLPIATPSEATAQKASGSTGGLSQLFAHLLAQVKAQTSGADGQPAAMLPGGILLQTPATAAPTLSEAAQTTPTETEKTEDPETGSVTISEGETASTVSAVYLQTLVPFVPVVAEGLPTQNPVPVALPLNSTGRATSSVDVPTIDTPTTGAVVSTTPLSYMPVVSINTPRTMPEQRLVALSPDPITGPTQKQANPISAASPLPSVIPDNAPSVDAPTVPAVAAPAAQNALTAQQAAQPQALTVSELNVQNLLNSVQTAPQPRLPRFERSGAPTAPGVPVTPSPRAAGKDGDTTPSIVVAHMADVTAGAAPIATAGPVVHPMQQTTGKPDASPSLSQTISPVVVQVTPDPGSASGKTGRAATEKAVPTAPHSAASFVVTAPNQADTTERLLIETSAVKANGEIPVKTAVGNDGENTSPQATAVPSTPGEIAPMDGPRPPVVAAASLTTPDAAIAPLSAEQADSTERNKTQNETTIAAAKTVMSQPIASATTVPTTVVSATDVPVEDVQPENRHIAMARPTMTSPESTTAALSTSHHPAPEENGDAAPSERRDSSDARHRSQSEPEANSSTSPAKPADTMPIEKSITKSVEKTAAPQSAPQSGHDRVRVVEQVTQKIETLRLTTGRQEATVHLRPENLGDLRLTIVTERNSITAHVMAETTFARQAVEEGRDQLRAALEQKGYSLQGLDVSLNQSGGHNANDRRFQPFEQPGQSQSRSYRNDLVQETAPVAPSARAASTNSQARLNGRLDYTA